MQQLSGAFRGLPKPSRRTKGSLGIGTSSGGRCLRPDAPFLAHAAARHGSGSPLSSHDSSRGDEARRLYDEAALLAKYAGPELVSRDSVAIFLDWDVTIAVYLPG